MIHPAVFYDNNSNNNNINNLLLLLLIILVLPPPNKHGVNSITELELMGNSNSGIGTAYLKKMELELINLELEFATKS